MRLFVAADLPDALRERLAAAQRDLRALPFTVRWVRPDGIHLTFAFLGEVAAERQASIRQAIEEAVRVAPASICLRAIGVGVFPERGRPRVIWAGIEGDLESVSRLKAAIDAALAERGFPPEARAFTPHLTLGRVREGPGSADHALFGRHARDDFGEIVVRDLHLYESRLEAGGARYLSLAVVPMTARAS